MDRTGVRKSLAGIRQWTPGDAIRLPLTSFRIAAGLVVLQAALWATIGLSAVGVDVGVLRATLAFVVLTFVPGFLVLRIAGIAPESYATGLLYTVGISLVVLMGLGAAFNFVYLGLGVAEPLFLVPETIGIALVGLTAAYYVLVEEAYTVELRLERIYDPLVLGLSLLPFLAVFGALLLTRYEQNGVLLVLYCVLALLPFAVVGGRVPDRLLSYTIWIASVSLLLQNTLTGQYLAWGDQPKEARLAMFVLQQGYWDPALAPGLESKFVMLRIVVLHPLHALFTDLHLVWVFKLIHPLLFSLAPVALYEAYANYFDEEVAFLSAYLFVSLFSFFVVLSRNTRTATAILFLALIVLVLADDHLEHVHAKGLGILFVSAIAVSHYGVSYMVLLALVLALPLTRLVEALTGASARRLTSPAYLLTYFAFTIGWYMYLSPTSKAFYLVVDFGRHFASRLTDQYVSEPESTSATTRYVTSDFNSWIIEFLATYNLFIGGIIIVGVSGAFWVLFWRGRTAYDGEYLAYAAVFLAVFSVTFLPVERFNTARTYPTTLVFFAPFFVAGVRRISQLGSRVVGVDGDRIPVRTIATVVIVVYFVLNVGLVSATVAHQYSPNVLVEKDRVVDGGHPEERTYFYKQYPTEYGIMSTRWMFGHAESHTAVHSSTWPGGMTPATGHLSWKRTATGGGPYLETRPIPDEGQVGSGYVYLNAFSHHRVGNVVRYPSGHFEFRWRYTTEIMSQWSHKNRIYSNGKSTIYR